MAFWNKDKKDEVGAKTDLGRNDPCHCGSGKKYKKCCMAKDEATASKSIQENWEKSVAKAKAEAEKNEKEAAKTPKDVQTQTHTPKASQAPAKQQHPTFIPNQVNLPRKSGGG